MIIPASGGGFSRTEVLRALSGIEGVRDLRAEGVVAADADCRFVNLGEATLVHLSRDLSRVSVSGLGDSSLKFAIEFQSAMPLPLRAFDLDYSFDLDLMSISSVEVFRELVDNALS